MRLHTPLCSLLGIDFPILQAGMGKAKGTPTTPALVAAVSEAGGMGCLGAAGLEPEEIRNAIHEIRLLTSRTFAVGLLLPASLAGGDASREEIRRTIEREYHAHWEFVEHLYARHELTHIEMPMLDAISPGFIKKQVMAVFAESAPVLVSGLGDPAWLVKDARARGVKLLGLAGSIRNAVRQKAAGVDVVIAQGYEAGGHTGLIATLPLVPQVVDAVSPIPVVAAGGIGDGRGLAAALALGAQGVWCGTAFLYARETAISQTEREALSAVSSEDLVVSRSYTGKPSRVIRNQVLDSWAQSGLDPLPMPYQFVLMDDFVYSAQQAGRYDLVNSPAGQVAGMLHRQEPAAEIIHRMVADAAQILADLQTTLRPPKAPN